MMVDVSGEDGRDSSSSLAIFSAAAAETFYKNRKNIHELHANNFGHC